MSIRKAPSYITDAEQANGQENSAGATRQDHPAEQNDECKPYYSTDRLRCIDRERRTDLRSLDEHASWREIARACHCEPGR